MTTADLYILYGFQAFICLLLVTVIVILVRQSAAIGRLEGLIPRVEKLEQEVGNLRDQLGDLREQVAELKGILLGVNDRIDLLVRHRHDGVGRVVIVPEEAGVAAD